ncbi:uncharacterized protein LOC132194936 [Neocloeon triangulifer]|uniref:uncharacterized protein LOC132194936 n=1 Tax=Neocloeon triangulifer TaxID=2078957 RepID=UPI00286EF133|nr:uncharacterized protein LOC132194936 [Neocloeon triangulifer]
MPRAVGPTFKYARRRRKKNNKGRWRRCQAASCACISAEDCCSLVKHQHSQAQSSVAPSFCRASCMLPFNERRHLVPIHSMKSRLESLEARNESLAICWRTQRKLAGSEILQKVVGKTRQVSMPSSIFYLPSHG